MEDCRILITNNVPPGASHLGQPHPKFLFRPGRGILKTLTPRQPFWEKGLGDEGPSVNLGCTRADPHQRHQRHLTIDRPCTSKGLDPGFDLIAGPNTIFPVGIPLHQGSHRSFIWGFVESKNHG